MTENTTEDRYASLAEEAEKKEPELRSWFGGGENDESTLVGEVVRYDSRTTKHGVAKIVVLRLKGDEEVQVWLSRSVLKNEFEQWSPQPDELVAVAYLGQKQGANGTYHNYNVRVDGRSKPAATNGQKFSDADAQTELMRQAEQDTRDETADDEIPF